MSDADSPGLEEEFAALARISDRAAEAIIDKKEVEEANEIGFRYRSPSAGTAGPPLPSRPYKEAI